MTLNISIKMFPKNSAIWSLGNKKKQCSLKHVVYSYSDNSFFQQFIYTTVWGHQKPYHLDFLEPAIVVRNYLDVPPASVSNPVKKIWGEEEIGENPFHENVPRWHMKLALTCLSKIQGQPSWQTFLGYDWNDQLLNRSVIGFR